MKRVDLIDIAAHRQLFVLLMMLIIAMVLSVFIDRCFTDEFKYQLELELFNAIIPEV